MPPPRRRRPAAVQLVKDRAGRSVHALVAAAQYVKDYRVGTDRPKKDRGKDVDWQAEVWELRDLIGEFRFGLQWQANAVSRVKLVAATAGIEGPDPIDEGEAEADPADATARQMVREFAGGALGQAALLKRAGLQLAAVGECYIVIRALDESVTSYAPSECKVTGSGPDAVWIVGGDQLAEGDLVIHVRNVHPADSKRVDCASKAALPILRELRGLNMQLTGAIDSRLAGAGVFIVPQSVSPPPKPPVEGNAEAAGEEHDPILEALIEAMLTPIKDRESAAAVVPIVLRVPDESTGRFQHIRFDAPFDPELRALREEALKRLSVSLDVPPEVLTGLADVNHWNAWMIDEAAIKYAIAPIAEVLAGALTDGWLRPALSSMRDMGQFAGNPNTYTVWIDTGELETRADKSDTALALYDRGELTPEATRREAGLSEGDAPADEDQMRTLLLALLRQSPALAPALLPILFPAVSWQFPADGMTAGPGSPPELPVAPAEHGPPATMPDAAGLLAAANIAVVKALETASKRVTNSTVQGSRAAKAEAAQFDGPSWLLYTRFPVEARHLDYLLAGVWSCLDGMLPADVVSRLDGYVRDLLTAGVVHDVGYLARLLGVEHAAA